MGGIVAYSSGLFETDSILVHAADAERRSLTRTVEAFGRVQPRRWMTVRPQVSGQIVALPVDEGMRVSAGALLARLQTDRYQSRVAKARARLKQRKARVARRQADSVRAQRRVDRQTALFRAGASFEARRQNARHAMTEAAARLAAARAQVDEARAQLERMKQRGRHLELRTPAAGVVSQLRVDVGEHVVGTGLVPGTAMMRIDQRDRMVFRVHVGESTVPMISIGDSATVRMEAHPGEAYAARVAAVARSRRSPPSGRQTERPATAASPSLFALGAGYPVRLTLRCPEHEEARSLAGPEATPPDCPALRTGMSGTARIRATTVDSAVTVPRSAVTFRHRRRARAPDDSAGRDFPSPRPVVFTVRNGIARRQFVETGLRTEQRVEIHSGLRPGDEVVTGPADAVQRRLSNGNAVAVHDALPVGGSKE